MLPVFLPKIQGGVFFLNIDSTKNQMAAMERKNDSVCGGG